MRPSAVLLLALLVFAPGPFTLPQVRAAEAPTRAGAKPPRPELPGDFEPQAGLVLAAAEADEEHLSLVIEVARAAATKVVVVVLAGDDDDEQTLIDRLEAGRAIRSDGHPIHVARVPHDTRWARDYGPVLLLDAHREPVMLDFEYGAIGEEVPGDDRARDERVPPFLADAFETRCLHVPLLVDGGNIVTNGAGLGVTTRTLLDENRDLGRRDDQVIRQLESALGLDRLLVLEPLDREPTGHVDMFVTFTGRRDVVVARIDPKRDPFNAALLDENALRLAEVRTRHGPLRVTRIPMPSLDDGRWRSYTNVVYLNGLILVPSYPNVPAPVEREARAVYRRLLPKWAVIPIDCTPLLTGGGALRCISSSIPWLPGGPFSERVCPWR